MFCSSCGKPLPDGAQFCESCGTKMGTDPSSRMPNWMKVILALLAIGLLYALFQLGTTSQPQSVVEDQINAIRNEQLTEAYYNYTSKEFQEATPLDKFKEFVRAFPALTKNSTATFDEPQKEEEGQSIKAELMSADGEKTLLRYHLLEDDDKWKIINIKVIKDEEKEQPSATNEDYAVPVENQLKALKAHQLDQAYNDYVSNEFKEITPFDRFLDFIKNFPIMTDYESYAIEEPEHYNGIAKVKATLKGANDALLVLEYSVVYVAEGWKIAGVQITSTSNLTSSIPDFNADDLLVILNSFVEDLKANQLEQAYNTHTSQDFKKATSYDNFKQFIESHPVLNHVTDYTFDKLGFNGNIATYQGTLVNEDKPLQEVQYQLIQEDGKWKILKIELLDQSEKT